MSSRLSLSLRLENQTIRLWLVNKHLWLQLGADSHRWGSPKVLQDVAYFGLSIEIWDNNKNIGNVYFKPTAEHLFRRHWTVRRTSAGRYGEYQISNIKYLDMDNVGWLLVLSQNIYRLYDIEHIAVPGLWRTYLINGTSTLLSYLATACAQDLGEVLTSSEKVGYRDLTLGAKSRTEWLVNFGQLVSMRL